jgi:hypothetical protein
MTTTANAAATPTTIQWDFTHHLIITPHPKKHHVSGWIQIYTSPQLK